MYKSRQDSSKERRHDEGQHVHEVQGSVKIAERREDPHNHRFATVTGEAKEIPCNNHDHVHEVFFARTPTRSIFMNFAV